MDHRQVIEISDSSDGEASPVSVRSRSVLRADSELNSLLDLDDTSMGSVSADDHGLVYDEPPRYTNEEHMKPLSEQGCLTQVLEIFPDISHDHVGQLYRDSVAAGELTFDFCETLVRKILDGGTYPKEKDKQELKRKRAPSDSENDEIAELQKNDVAPHRYFELARDVLGDEFPNVPMAHIAHLLRQVHRFYPAYLELENTERTFDPNAAKPPYFRLKTGRKGKRITGNKLAERNEELSVLRRIGYDLSRELELARRTRAKSDATRKVAADKANAEAMNEQEARDTGNMMDCGCCFTEQPINRMTHCNGDEPHFFCLDCAKRNVEVDIGQSRCRPKCMDVSGCSGGFDRVQLLHFLELKTFEALERMQQQEDIRLAGLDDLEECPFCDFKAICPPVDVDREFRCGNPECTKVSCRLCRRETHIPQSCEEFAKENKLTVRHAVEEAMTQALVRSCNKCKTPFIKEFGCNKMSCSKCGTKQCYVCSKTVADYQHFDSVPHGAGPGGCPLYDNTEQRHDEDVRKAEAAAVAELQKEHPEISVDDLKIKVSGEVQRAERQRLEDGRLGNVRPGQVVFPPAMPPGLGQAIHAVNPAGDHAQIRQGRLARLRQIIQQEMGLNRPALVNNAPPAQLNVILNHQYPINQPVAPVPLFGQFLQLPAFQPPPVQPPGRAARQHPIDQPVAPLPPVGQVLQMPAFQPPPVQPPRRAVPQQVPPAGYQLGDAMPGPGPAQMLNLQTPFVGIPAPQAAGAQDGARLAALIQRAENLGRGVEERVRYMDRYVENLEREIERVRPERQRRVAEAAQLPRPQGADQGGGRQGFGLDRVDDVVDGWHAWEAGDLGLELELEQLRNAVRRRRY